MASTWLPALLFVASLPCGLPLRPEDHLDTKAVQFRAVPSRVATGLLPVRVPVPLSAFMRFDLSTRAACRRSPQYGQSSASSSVPREYGGRAAAQPRPKSCECEDSLARTSHRVVGTLLALGLERAQQPRHHALSWVDAVRSRDHEDDAEDAEDARVAEEHAEVAAVRDSVRRLMDDVAGVGGGNGSEVEDVEPTNMSPALATLVRNLTDSARCLAAYAMKDGAGEIARQSSSSRHSDAIALLEALLEALSLLPSALLNPCRRNKLPTVLEISIQRSEAEHEALRVFPGVKPLHSSSPAKPGSVLGVTCTLLDDASGVLLEYLLPVKRSESVWHLYVARPVAFLQSGRRCTLFVDEVLFATNGTDVRDCTSGSPRSPMIPLFDDVYLLPRESTDTHRERCLRALVHSASADEAQDACPVVCQNDEDHTSVKGLRPDPYPSSSSVDRLNATSFAVLNPASAVAVQCPGRVDVLLPRISSGRHEATLPCECLARDEADDGEVLVHRGAACGDGAGPRTALVVDSEWTDGGFAPASLYTTRGDAAVRLGKETQKEEEETQKEKKEETQKEKEEETQKAMEEETYKEEEETQKQKDELQYTVTEAPHSNAPPSGKPAVISGGGGGRAEAPFLWVALTVVALMANRV